MEACWWKTKTHIRIKENNAGQLYPTNLYGNECWTISARVRGKLKQPKSGSTEGYWASKEQGSPKNSREKKLESESGKERWNSLGTKRELRVLETLPSRDILMRRAIGEGSEMEERGWKL